MADIDALVLSMRATRTTEGIMKLYEQLFRLEEWFVPNDPSLPLGNPMQWRFEGGLDPSPCILAYTDVDRAKQQADKVAASFGKSGEVMALSVEDAVSWMLSGELDVTWACFNLGPSSPNFPLHFDELAKLAASFGIRVTSNDSFFPPEYKTFPFREGDLLASPRSDGNFAISKVLKIDKIVLKAGESISIQGQRFVAPSEDFLLVISCAVGESEFASLDAAREAAAANRWTVHIGHVPNRAPGAAADKIVVGFAPVTDDELVGYRLWRESFDNGEAGIF
jgi:hypothetical protein